MSVRSRYQLNKQQKLNSKREEEIKNKNDDKQNNNVPDIDVQTWKVKVVNVKNDTSVQQNKTEK